MTSEGIDMPDVEVPPGTYLLRIEVKDSLDRKSVGEVKLLVQ
jgi:fibronectin type 3 domain-containing protein